MHFRSLRFLLLLHGFVTLAAGVVLVVDPGLIPHVVGITLDPHANLVAYLLAGAEFGFAVLSFGGSRIAEPHALRLIVLSCVTFHGLSGILETYAYFQGVSPAILANVAARLIVVSLFSVLSRASRER
jgi:hypothetical protein